MWEVVDSIIAQWESMTHHNFPNYLTGTWGRGEAHLLAKKEGRLVGNGLRFR